MVPQTFSIPIRLLALRRVFVCHNRYAYHSRVTGDTHNDLSRRWYSFDKLRQGPLISEMNWYRSTGRDFRITSGGPHVK